MKKNKSMRLASYLLILTLISTSVIGGAFAKYITSDSAHDIARVAKFGVVATISGELFGPTYSAVGSGNKIITYDKTGGTVSSSDKADVVAPGTKGDTLTFSVKGTPEVATKVSFGEYLDADGKNAKYYCAEPQLVANSKFGVMVPFTGELTKESIQGKYITDNSDGLYFKKVTPDADVGTGITYYEMKDMLNNTSVYKPLIWTATVNGTAQTPTRDLSAAKTSILSSFQTSGADATFNPNMDNTLNASLTWEWNFEDDNLSTTTADAKPADEVYSVADKPDTILGDMMSVDSDGKLNTDQYLVREAMDGDPGSDNWYPVKTKTVKVMSDSNAENTVIVAWSQVDPGSFAYNAELGALASDYICAVLTAAFDAAITVAQVD